MSISLSLALLTLAIWLYLLCARGNFWRSCYDSKQIASPAAWPDICIIVPARNEAEILPVTLPTLLANDYPGKLHVIMVDDRSEDATANVAAHIAQNQNAAQQLSIVNGSPTPAGWKGKVWAMHNGLEHVKIIAKQPHYILFTDADIAYDAGSITQLVAHAEANNLVLNSMMVQLRCISFAERFFIPAFVYFFQMLYPFDWVNDPKRKTAAAAGGCMLARYDALMLAGGITPIRDALIDDCALGRQMKRQGPIRLSLTQHVHSMRAYPHFQDIRTMIARSAYDQLGYSPVNLMVSLLGMLLIFVAPLFLLFFAVGNAWAWNILSFFCMVTTFIPILRFYGRSPVAAFALPLIAVMYMGFTLDSAWQYWGGRGGLWKGRFQSQDVQNA